MPYHAHRETLNHIRNALERADELIQALLSGQIDIRHKVGGDPVTAVDDALDKLLRQILPRDGEGWLSEETIDDLDRLGKDHVWVVDPLDGTREFVARIPEWCVSIALVEAGQAVAGGVLNPQTRELFLGATGLGLTYNGQPAQVSERTNLEGGLVLASRSEVNRGEWERFKEAPYQIQPMGSVAYKLARVSAGLADATWTLVPKHEWDVAGGVALVLAAGGTVYSPEGNPVFFNRKQPLLTGLVAHAPTLTDQVREELRRACLR